MGLDVNFGELQERLQLMNGQGVQFAPGSKPNGGVNC